MSPRLMLLALFPLAFAAAEDIPKAIQVTEPPAGATIEGQDRVISSTRQFRVSGGEPGERAAVAMLAEQAKTDLLKLTGDPRDLSPNPSALGNSGTPATDPKDKTPIPIILVLHGKPGDPPPRRTMATSIHVGEAGYQIRLDAHLCRGIESDRIIHAVTEALVYERALQKMPPGESGGRFLVPSWLAEGLQEAIVWELGRGDRRPYEALFKSGGLFKLDDLFGYDAAAVDDMDSATRLAFRVSSGALVMALLQQPLGKEGFNALLTEIAAFQGETPVLLRRHFPGLNLSETSLAKWLALQLANMGGKNPLTEVLTVSQSEVALEDALKLDFKTPDGILQRKPISAWPEVAGLPEADRAATVGLARQELGRLSFRCFPSYRPIIAEYQTVLAAIAINKTKDLATRLDDLATRRTVMTAKALRARDYLDWFEITRARETSGVFDDYMRLKERLKANPHHREDNLSKYLDRMDAIFSRGGASVPPVAAPPVIHPPDADFLPELPPLPR